MNITAKELAAICGVSIGTVDRALHDRPGINRETKEKILRVANEVSYRPNYVARSLVKGRTKTIGVVILNLHNQFFSQMVNAIESRARESDYFAYLTMTDKYPEEEKNCLNHLASLKVDGIILFPINKGNMYDQYLKSLRTPIVTIGNMVSKYWPFVGIQDRKAIKDAVYFIASKGYRHIVYVSPPLAHVDKVNSYEVEERLAGYREAVKEIGSPEGTSVIRNREFGQELEKAIFGRKGKTAILCSSDKYALEVLEYLRLKGIRVPEDIGLMGFDNIDVLRFVQPRITTVAYPISEMGRTAFHILLERMNEKTGDHTRLLDTSILEGESL